MSGLIQPRGTRYVAPVLIIVGWTGFVKGIFPHIELVNLVMTYLLANVLIAVRFGQGPSVMSAILSVASLDFFFVPPHLTFAVADTKYLVTFLIMLGVTLLTSRLTVQLRRSVVVANRAQIEAEREGVISSLLSSISHDLRTPLTSISGAASTLLAHEPKLPTQDHQRLLKTIVDESDHLNRLVEKILQITRIESGHIPLHKEMHSLEEIVGSALNRMESLLQDRPLTTEIPEDLPLVPLDDLLIEQVLVNLLENALRYTPPGSPIDIQVSRNLKEIRVEILDRGPGIPLSDQGRIFEKFYRSGPRKETWGSGLGLAICRGIVKVHQGEIGVKNREGGGSIFYFFLPLGGSKP